jgi:hypothetical protein
VQSNASYLPDFGLGFIYFPHFVRNLAIEEFKVDAVEDNPFIQFKNVEKLYIANCVIKSVTKNFLSGLENLKLLRLYNSRLSALDIEKLTNLVDLEIFESVLENDADIFQTLPQFLGKIYFNGLIGSEDFASKIENNLTKLLYVNSNLKTVDLANFHILDILNFSHNKLENISIANLSSLILLDLSYNNISNQDMLSFQHNLNKLAYVNLSNNLISELNLDYFRNISQLRSLDLSNNFLQKIKFQLSPSFTSIVDDNDWDCLWLQQLFISAPEVFAKLRYKKVITKFGFRGLPCVFFEIEIQSTTSITITPTNRVRIMSNARTPGFTNNHVSTIVAIIFGILVAQVLFVMYNRYRKLSHKPFYHQLPKDKIYHTTSTPEFNSEYEFPLTTISENLSENIYEEIPEEPRGDDTLYDILKFYNLDET